VPGTGFTDLGIAPGVAATLAASGIQQPTPIQQKTLPDALSGRDVLGRAQTGSGKTLAFGLALLTRLAAQPRRAQPTRPHAVVLVPTRELAQQVEAAMRPVSCTLGLTMAVIVGGLPINKQIAELRRGVDVVVATPGRLHDLMQRNAIRLDAVSVAVLDEADHMADLGFLPTVTRILDAMPADRQCLLFSATLDKDVDRLVKRYLTRPAVHQVDDSAAAVAGMEHRVFNVTREDKIAVAAEIAGRTGRTLFFVRTKHGADRLARQFRSRGVDAAALHGNMNQNQRRRALDAFTSGERGVLVATDVAARGIHVDDLDVVVHYDPPNDSKVYAHRSGRTARAGAEGTVVTLVEPQQRNDVRRIHVLANVDAQSETVFPGHATVRELSGAAR
jgi:superfamily II DNA/RNA helicase